tara:strand:- start:52 stop:687 length:636 start_codon:yes stop_codon:yes gene_type:complete
MRDEEDKDVNFLKRWSGRKTALREEDPDKQATVPVYEEVELPDRQDENDVENIAVPEDLPDIDTLNKDSDFSLFMREGTPEHLKKIALRKLFNSDPAFSVLDGLNDYDEDYSMIGMVTEAVSTRYKPGRGMVDSEDEKNAEEGTKNLSDERRSDLDNKRRGYSDNENGQDQLSDLETEQEPAENFVSDGEVSQIEEEKSDEDKESYPDLNV